ncbi:MAG: hypothetical protein PWP31_1798 [Clostridia bacterium]|nr:hypothetical protein [Clostridia bacterium]
MFLKEIFSLKNYNNKLDYYLSQMGIRTRLFLLVSLVLVPLFIFHLITICNHFEIARENELNSIERLAWETNAVFFSYVQNLWNRELTLGEAISIQNPPLSSDKIKKYLQKELYHDPTVLAFHWINPNKSMIVTTVKEQRYIQNLLTRKYIQSIQQGQDKVISDLIVDDMYNNNPVIEVATAIRCGEKLFGILIATININKLDLVLSLNNNNVNTIGIKDSKGQLIYCNGISPNITLDQRKRINNSPSEIALKRHMSVNGNFYSDLDKTYIMESAVPIQDTGWVAFASAPIHEIYSTARYKTVRDLTTLLFSTTLCLLLVVLFGNKILQPITSLEKAAKDISHGKLDTRVMISGKDELAVAGEAFNKMAERIQEMEENRNRFLKIVAHELRNPMAGIKGIIALIQKQITNGKPISNMTPMLEVADREINRLNQLLSEVLDTYSITGGHLPLNLAPVNLVKVIRLSVKPFLLSDKQKHEFVLKNVDNPVWVIGDANRLENVFRNLISNAIKYSPKGGKIEVILKVEEKNVVVSISDQGIGIPKDKLNNIFDAFYRVNNHLEGIGLGLFISKSIVQRHMGRLWVESEEGKGSTFYVELPLYR